MDLLSTTIILWISFSVFLILVIAVICGFASSLALKFKRRTITEVRTVQDTSFNGDLEKSTPEV